MAAPISLAAASGWASVRLGFSLTEAAALGAAALAAGLAAIKVVGRAKADDSYQFRPATFEEPELGELLLEAKDEILLLDDPLIEPNEDLRVVRLFARHQPTPGELVERIEGFPARWDERP